MEQTLDHSANTHREFFAVITTILCTVYLERRWDSL